MVDLMTRKPRAALTNEVPNENQCVCLQGLWAQKYY
jgi:hypothetical protein